MATLEQIKPYLDKQIGLRGYGYIEWDPTGEGYGAQEIFVCTTSDPEWYILNLPDYSDMENRWGTNRARVELLGTWSNIRRFIGAIPHVGKEYLNSKDWRLDIDPLQKEESKPKSKAAKNQSSQ